MNTNSQTECLFAQLDVNTGKIRWLSASSDSVFFCVGIPVNAEQVSQLNAASASGDTEIYAALHSAKTTKAREIIMADAVARAFVTGLGHSLPLLDVNGDEVNGAADLCIERL